MKIFKPSKDGLKLARERLKKTKRVRGTDVDYIRHEIELFFAFRGMHPKIKPAKEAILKGLEQNERSKIKKKG